MIAWEDRLPGPIKWFANNPVAANLLMLSILVIGVLASFTIRKEAFPSFEAQRVTVQMTFRGGTPEDVERGVTLKIEEALDSVQGVDRIFSVSTENGATVTVQALDGYDVEKLLEDVKIKVDAIPTFPAQTENPVISENKRANNVLYIEVYGDVDEALLKETARDIRDDLLQMESISRVNTIGARDYEISVEVSEEKLREYDLTFAEVSRIVRDNSIDLGAGVIRSQRGEISLRTRSQGYVAEDFSSIIVRTSPSGARVTLGEIAIIRDGYIEQDYLARFQGQRTVSLQILNEGDDDILVGSNNAKALVQAYQESGKLPEGVSLQVWNDESRVISSRLNLLFKNGFLGVFFVCFVLALFLNLRLALWVSLGIPISIAGAIIFFPAVGLTVNVLTTFALIIVMGVIVDDAVVIGESIYSEKKKDKDNYRATMRGVGRVVVPAAFGILTSVAAFLPLTQTAGRMGQAFGQIGWVVVLCLIFSLVESKLVLPAHLMHLDVHRKFTNPLARGWSKIQGLVSLALSAFLKRIYTPLLELSLKFRYMGVACFVALFIVVIGMVPSGAIRAVFFPNIELDAATANLELEEGLPVEYLHELAGRIESTALALGEEIEADFGANPIQWVQAHASSNTKASISVELVPDEDREMPTSEFINRWREKVGPLYGAKALSYFGSAGPPGDGVKVDLRSEDLPALRLAAQDLKNALRDYKGVLDVNESFRSGKPEIQVNLTPEGQAYGFSRSDLGSQVRNAFFGAEAQRVQRNREEVRVMVRYPLEERQTLSDLENLRIRGGDGQAVPFGVVADLEFADGLASIERSRGERVVTVKAEIDKAKTAPEDVLNQLKNTFFEGFLKRHPEVTLNLEGEAEQRQKSVDSLIRNFIISLLFIYALLAIPLRSYTNPLVIMAVIPFGIVGALLGHWFVGIPVSILSFFGIVALSGVVVNDSLLLCNTIEQGLEEGDALGDAVRGAGMSRFRAVFLTSLTTFVGLVPLLLETAVQAQFLIPMAVSLGFGILFATTITLFLLPMLYLIFNDIKRAFRYWWAALTFSDVARVDEAKGVD